jgi:predicted site-specific integrase-resolvase
VSAPAGHVTMAEAARRLGIARTRVYSLQRMGLLQVIHHDGRMYVPEAVIRQRLAGKGQLLENCLTTRQVAQRFHVSMKTVEDWRKKGLLHPTKIHNRLCFDPAEVAKFVPPSRRPRLDQPRK